MARFAFPIAVVLLGIGWLLDSLGVTAQVSMLWVLGLAAIGLLILLTQGVTRETIVSGPFFLAAAAFSWLRQLEVIGLEVELPCLVIVFGILLAVANAKFGGPGSPGGTTPLN